MSEKQIYEITGEKLVKELRLDFSAKVDSFEKRLEELKKELGGLEPKGHFDPWTRRNFVSGVKAVDPMPKGWKLDPSGGYLTPNKRMNIGKELQRKLNKIRSKDLFSELDPILGCSRFFTGSKVYYFFWSRVRDKLFISLPVALDTDQYKDSLATGILLPWTNIAYKAYLDEAEG